MLFIFLIFLMNGCGRKTPILPRVVVRIDVAFDSRHCSLRRAYTEDEKIEQILSYIRTIGVQKTPQIDPTVQKTSLYHITLHFSDGQKKFYCQKGSVYWREGHSPWKEVSKNSTQGFLQTISAMPSDIPVRSYTAMLRKDVLSDPFFGRFHTLE